MSTEKPVLLKRNPLLERLVQPMNEDGRRRLKSEIIRNPDNIVIHSWQGFILFDYDKYDLCRLLRKTFTVKDHSFGSIDEAASFACSSQLVRTDLTSEYRKYLIGQKFHFEENITLADSAEKNVSKYRIAYKIGEELNLSGGTVMKYNVYSTSIDKIYSQSEELARRILSGKVRVSHENTIELSRLSSDEIVSLSRAVVEENISHLTFSDIRHEVQWRHTHSKSTTTGRKERRDQKERVEAGIRQMPSFDPDSEVNSLCMTIVSWKSSIERVNRSVDFDSISSRAKLELMKQLTVLEQTIKTMEKSLVERTAK